MRWRSGHYNGNTVVDNKKSKVLQLCFYGMSQLLDSTNNNKNEKCAFVPTHS
jgi:hypothetical protein